MYFKKIQIILLKLLYQTGLKSTNHMLRLGQLFHYGSRFILSLSYLCEKKKKNKKNNCIHESVYNHNEVFNEENGHARLPRWQSPNQPNLFSHF